MKKVIVGLGNPGLKYKFTRHNLGYLVVDLLAKEEDLKWKESARFKAKFCAKNDIAFLKPETFMNDSGTSVSKFLAYYNLTPENMIVIHDDLDLPFLQLKKQLSSGSAGHHGVDDIIQKLSTTAFWRLRVGIGRPENKGIETSDWVLSNFSKSELEAITASFIEIKKLLF